jgi:hypothetical protein
LAKIRIIASETELWRWDKNLLSRYKQVLVVSTVRWRALYIYQAIRYPHLHFPSTASTKQRTRSNLIYNHTNISPYLSFLTKKPKHKMAGLLGGGGGNGNGGLLGG